MGLRLRLRLAAAAAAACGGDLVELLGCAGT